MNSNSNNMYTTDVMVTLWDVTIVQLWVTARAAIITLTVPCVLRRDLVLQIPDSPIQGNFLHVNHTNVFATRSMVTINACGDVNIWTMRISRNSGEFVCLLEIFTCWQTDVDSYKTALTNYSNMNNVTIDPL